MAATPRAERQTAARVNTLHLAQGQIVRLVDGLRLKVVRIVELTSRGCLGGPMGCQDQVDVEVTRRKVKKLVTLRVPRNETDKKKNVHESRVFGYILTLTALGGGQITLVVSPVS